jgi:hypothetical protein
VKFGLKPKAQTNITKASSQNTSILPCFLETGANLAFKLPFLGRLRAARNAQKRSGGNIQT